MGFVLIDTISRPHDNEKKALEFYSHFDHSIVCAAGRNVDGRRSGRYGG